MSDIAARAGVSQTTVSFVLNGRSGQAKIAEETRQRVLDVARELGYRRNELARAMVTGKTRVIGFLTYDGESEHIWKMISGALDEAALRGYSVKVQRLPFFGSHEEIRDIIHNCSNWRLDGIIALTLKDNDFDLLEIETKKNGWSVVYMETAPKEGPAVQVGTDDRNGIRSAVEHLVQLGHRRIAFLSGPMNISFVVQRNLYFLDAMQELLGNGHEGFVQTGHWSNVEIVERSVEAILRAPAPPTAMLCAGDGAAMLAAKVVRSHGLRVPEDLSLIGFGNFRFANYCDPPLTSIAQPFRDIGRVAVSHLIDAIESGTQENSGTPNPASYKISLPTSLCVRQSTAPPRHRI